MGLGGWGERGSNKKELKVAICTNFGNKKWNGGGKYDKKFGTPEAREKFGLGEFQKAFPVAG